MWSNYFIIVIGVIVMILLNVSHHKYNKFIVEMVCERPYRFLAYLGLYAVACWNPLAGMMVMMNLVIIDSNVDAIVEKSTKR